MERNRYVQNPSPKFLETNIHKYWDFGKSAADPEKSPIFDGSETSMGGNGAKVSHKATAMGPAQNGGGCVDKGPFAKYVTISSQLQTSWLITYSMTVRLGYEDFAYIFLLLLTHLGPSLQSPIQPLPETHKPTATASTPAACAVISAPTSPHAAPRQPKWQR